MNLKSADLQNQINELDLLIQQGASDAQLNLWEIQRKELQGQLQVALEEETELQERIQAEEAEIELIKLPYDFNELYSEEGRQITDLNEMIIEVVKDTKRQANIEKNQALDEQKAAYEAKLKLNADQHDSLFSDFTTLQDSYRALDNEFQIKTDALDRSNLDKAQAILERDDAYSKRDSAFKQLQEANEIIKNLQIKLENVPQPKSSLDISPSDKLAKMVKESLEAKVNRGLARWDIPVLEPVNEPIELVEYAEPIPIEDNERQAADTETDSSVERDRALDEVVGQPEQESEVDLNTSATKMDVRQIWDAIREQNEFNKINFREVYEYVNSLANQNSLIKPQIAEVE